MKFKKFPALRQHENMDCGPACLKIISKFYGKNLSLQYLRDLCDVTREGTSFLNLAQAAEEIGYRTLAVDIKIDQLLETPLPGIIHWKNRHYVVVYKVNKRNVFVSDPAIGLISYSLEDFYKNWYTKGKVSGYMLLLQPLHNFDIQETTSNNRYIRSIWEYIIPYKRAAFYLALIMLLVTGMQSALPFITRAIYDVGIRGSDLDFIYVVLMANIILTLTIACGNMARDVVVKHISARVGIGLISDYILKLMKLPIDYFEKRTSGDILQRAQDHERIKNFVTQSSFNVIFSIFTFLVFSIILGLYNTNLLWIFIIGSVLYVIWIVIFLKSGEKQDYKYFDLLAKNNSYWIETVNSMYDIKINNHGRVRRWDWERLQARLFKVSLKTTSLHHLQDFGSQIINGLKNVFLTFYSAKAVIDGEITMGTMISVQFIIGFMNAPLMQFVSFIKSAQIARISFSRLKSVNEQEDEESSIVSNNINLPDNRTIHLKNVFFQYTKNSLPILTNVNLSIPEGRVTALVGESGSGKTTLLKLLLRLYRPLAGEIKMGNINISNINLHQWRNISAAVLQESRLFNDTILKNIVLSEESIDYQQLKHAVKVSCISDYLESLPLGYLTKIGENGIGLSLGQKQRILIARAIYRNCDFLFLDEATNALDANNEFAIMQYLEKEFANKTVVIAAHRLSTIQKADQIIFLEHGKVIEVGKHTELISKRGAYYKLVKNQLSLETNENLTEK